MIVASGIASEQSSRTAPLQGQRRYEEYAYVLDFTQRAKSSTVRGREGMIIQAIGEERLTLLELLEPKI